MSAFVLTLLSDGWSGAQKEHVLNIMLATPKPLFMDNIYTKADRVDGTYQVWAAARAPRLPARALPTAHLSASPPRPASPRRSPAAQCEVFAAIIEKYPGLRAFCSDNAAVMRKTWRLLRAKFPGLLTYGCAPHAFNLHAKDICALPEFDSSVSTRSSSTSRTTSGRAA